MYIYRERDTGYYGFLNFFIPSPSTIIDTMEENEEQGKETYQKTGENLLD